MTFWETLARLWRGNTDRAIPNNYFRGYRRIAMTAAEITEPGKCWSCKHAVAYHRWHCDRGNEGCRYERCYVREELSPADYEAGRGKWLGLPPPEGK